MPCCCAPQDRLALRWVAKASRPLIDLYYPILARDVGQVVVASRAHDLPGVRASALGLIQVQLRTRSGQPSAARPATGADGVTVGVAGLRREQRPYARGGTGVGRALLRRARAHSNLTCPQSDPQPHPSHRIDSRCES
jgi:hypothetical protein